MAREVEAGESSNILPNLPRRSEGPSSDASRTIQLSGSKASGDSASNTLKWLAVMVGIGIILLAALLPDTIKNLGGRKPPTKEPPAATTGERPSTAPAPVAPSQPGSSSAPGGSKVGKLPPPTQPVSATTPPDAGSPR